MGPRILGLLHAGEYRRKPELSMQAGAAIAQFGTR
jgi:hypothetical protein